MVQKSSAFASINLLASLMYCNFFAGGGAIFAKITRCILWTPEHNTTFFARRPISLYHKRWLTWRPLACYAFIKIKLASCHLLLYLVYTCEKSFNFINAFACYKQKCKLPPFNLAHPVYLGDTDQHEILHHGICVPDVSSHILGKCPRGSPKSEICLPPYGGYCVLLTHLLGYL